MTNQQKFVVYLLALASLLVYFFVSAPQKLEDSAVRSAGKQIPIAVVFDILALENDVARSLYTKEIVGAGVKAGFSFNEDWLDEGVEAGPLPALFLREASANLKESSVDLGLFLGSDFPIAQSNLFSADQLEEFNKVKETGQAVLFKDIDSALNTAMFPDFASVMPCVTCHNEHPDSPKLDWELNDIMGATTWTYAKDTVGIEEAIEIINAFRAATAGAYQRYLDKVKLFGSQPEIGSKWPRDGYFLPDLDVFIAEFKQRASQKTLDLLLTASTSS